MNQMIYVRWVDSAVYDGEHTAADAEGLTPVIGHTAGWLVNEREDSYVVAMDWFDDGVGIEYRNLLVIPKVCTLEAVLYEDDAATVKLTVVTGDTEAIS